jgi:oligopeptide/dipeptide ABC transporter ATP-binding protein
MSSALSSTDRPSGGSAFGPLLELSGVSVDYGARSGPSILGGSPGFRAVNGVSLSVERGETVSIVGESGCGKTSIARSVLRRIDVAAGSIRFDGQDITRLRGGELRALRRRIQLVMQDPYTSLNPRMCAEELIAEPLVVHRLARGRDAVKRAHEMMEKVGLSSAQGKRYPHSFSGGQRQRIGIARALVLEPDLIVADEPVAALDVSVQAQIINLMQDLQEELGLSYLFIAHDLSVVRHLSHRVLIMYAGEVMEAGAVDDIFTRPKHPYTEALLAAVPDPESPRRLGGGAAKAPDEPAEAAGAAHTGCVFVTRCPLAVEACTVEAPPLERRPDGRLVACWMR